ncbi:MAG TPA: hypothetical protein DGH68_12510 [Bacteroidetes bacterium]|nr:hypothetical protein [Bacteroidota bacterium]
MVSNPVQRAPGADSIWQVFCGIRTCILGWGGSGYTVDCTARNGMGFWLKRPDSIVCCIEGEIITQDSIPVLGGWNLIGTISQPVPASSVYSIPPNIVASRFFKFSSGYVHADTLCPGAGYWVKTTQAGLIVLSSVF